MLRKIIKINEELCDGCGDCAQGCSEGAIEIIDGKAKLVKEEFCDGFGDCLGECPRGSITIEERESMPFNEKQTKEYLFKTKGIEAVWKMEESMKRHEEKPVIQHGGCPSKISIELKHENINNGNEFVPAQLSNWPIQLHLVPVSAPYYQNANLLIAADCCSFAYGNFHADFIKNHITMIGCPKLDSVNLYLQKLIAILANNNFKSITISYMEVPCCTGIVHLVEKALAETGKEVPIKKIKIGIRGNLN